MDERYRFINTETGEILEVDYADSEKSRKGIRNNTSEPKFVLNELKPNSELKQKTNNKRLEKTHKEPWVQSYQEKPRKLILSRDLKNNEKATLYTLSMFLTHEGIVEYPNEYGEPLRMNVKALKQLMGWNSDKTINEVLDSLEQKEFLIRVKNGREKFIDLNPKYFHLGKMEKRKKRVEQFKEKSAKARSE